MNLKQHGITLVEILIGAVVLSMVLGGIYSLFTGVSKSSGGIGAHSFVQRLSFTIMKKIESDIQNANKINPISSKEIEIESQPPSTIRWRLESSGNQKKIIRSVDGGSGVSFNSTGKIHDVEFIIHDDSNITGYSSHSSTKALHSGRIVADIGLEFIANKKKKIGFFRRIFSHCKIRGIKF